MNFIKSIFSEPDGSGSSTRIVMGMVVAFILGIGIAFATLVCKKGITIDQFDSFLGAGGAFIITVCGPLYGVNQVRNIMNTKAVGSSNGNGVSDVHS